MARKFKLIIEFVSIKNNNNIYDDQIMEYLSLIQLAINMNNISFQNLYLKYIIVRYYESGVIKQNQ